MFLNLLGLVVGVYLPFVLKEKSLKVLRFIAVFLYGEI
jgi:hypothetical protein